MSYVEKYKKGLAIVLGTICLFVALYAPGRSALMLTEEEIPWHLSNWIFLGLGIVFLWGEIVSLAKTFQGFFSKKAP